MLRRIATAAANDVDEAFISPAADEARRRLRLLIIFAQIIGQAGVGIGHDQRVGLAGQRLNVRPQFSGAKGAIEPHRHRLHMADRVPEGLHRLPGKVATGQISERHRQHHRHDRTARVTRFGRGKGSSLGVERVEHGFNQDEIHPAFQQRLDLLAIHVLHAIERHFAIAGVRHARG